MTCAVLAVPDVSRVGGGAQAPRAAVPIPDTLTFPRCVCGASPSVPAPAWRPLRAPTCVTAAEVWSVLFISGSPAWRPLQARGTCYSCGSVEHPLQSRSWTWRPLRAPGMCYNSGSVERSPGPTGCGAHSIHAHLPAACVCGASPSVPGPRHGAPSGHQRVLQQREVWSVPFSPSPAWRPLRAPARVTAAEVWP